jgi:hypothetical protein
MPERRGLKMNKVSVEIDDFDREAIGEQIKNGYTSGRLDSENGKKISWSIDMDVWID